MRISAKADYAVRAAVELGAPEGPGNGALPPEIGELARDPDAWLTC
jgi:hypothetical protein